MDFNTALSQWCCLSLDSHILIITDNSQLQIAQEIASQSRNKSNIILIEHLNEAMEQAKQLSSNDLLIVLLSFSSFIKVGANNYFSPFRSPNDVVSKYIFIRLSISQESLLQGLSTPKSIVYEKISEMNAFDLNANLRVTNDSGTDITLKIDAFDTCSHEVTNLCQYAFLPPSETSSGVITSTANGKIVVDVIVGQLYHFGNLLGEFGLVSTPITIVIKDGLVVDIYGNQTAEELKEKLFALPIECREIVELGQGLSKMKPTGLIGVDESIIDTCHFGIGDGRKCGVHLDVVISNPTITKIN